MTKSEIKTAIKSKRVFLPEFVKYSLKYNKNNQGEDELCDCLLEFQNVYTIIEVKERNEKFIEKPSKNWFHNKVEKDAVDRIVKFYNIYKKADDLSFYDENGSDISINSSFETMPVIVFDNPTIKNYKRTIYCSRINKFINVFSMDDFNNAFDVLLIPYEINRYLAFRISLLNKGDDVFNSRLVIGDFDNKLLLLGGGINSESDLVQYYCAARFDANIDPNEIEEKLLLFNKIANFIKESLDSNGADFDARRRIISFVNSVDINTAYSFAKKWEACINRCKEKNPLYSPFLFRAHDNSAGMLFLVKPDFIESDKFFDYSCLMMLMYAYQKHINLMYLVGFTENDGYVDTMLVGRRFDDLIYPDKELEDTITKYKKAGLAI